MKIHDNLLHPLPLNVFLAFSKQPQMNRLGYCAQPPSEEGDGQRSSISSLIRRGVSYQAPGRTFAPELCVVL